MTRQPDRRTVLAGLGAVAAVLGGNCRRATSGSWPRMRFFEHLGLVGGFLLVAWHDLSAAHPVADRQNRLAAWFASRSEEVMIDRSTLGCFPLTVAALGRASPAFAQSRDDVRPRTAHGIRRARRPSLLLVRLLWAV